MTTVPAVGMGVTEIWHTNRKAGTIIAVSKTGTRAKFQYDQAKIQTVDRIVKNIGMNVTH